MTEPEGTDEPVDCPAAVAVQGEPPEPSELAADTGTSNETGGLLVAVRGEPPVDVPVVNKTFMENVREALSNGYDRCCAHCGVGTSWDDMDIHERGCPEYRALR